MTALNKQALREAAEKATQGPWVEKCGEVTTADYDVEGVTFLDHICNCEIIGTESPNAEFIAAANPATVLVLLDELEAAENNLIDSECHVAELEESLRDKQALLESAEKRIAELEAKLANPVLLPKTNGYWNEQEKAYEEAITLAKRQVRLAGFNVEEM
ncbi:ead/Ea22-like family protein [Salmonella enterica subsp. enterica serovar Gatuni]|nr:ead/Ea22-like family protein [Salmonella enterica subsp. enterica serovar Gatuni]